MRKLKIIIVTLFIIFLIIAMFVYADYISRQYKTYIGKIDEISNSTIFIEVEDVSFRYSCLADDVIIIKKWRKIDISELKLGDTVEIKERINRYDFTAKTPARDNAYELNDAKIIRVLENH